MAPDSGRRLSGSLEDWPLVELLGWLHDCQRSGILRIRAGREDGQVFFSEGILYRCRWGRLHGEEALDALMRVTAAPFLLVQIDPPHVLPNVDTPTELLLERYRYAIDRPTAA